MPLRPNPSCVIVTRRLMSKHTEKETEKREKETHTDCHSQEREGENERERRRNSERERERERAILAHSSRLNKLRQLTTAFFFSSIYFLTFTSHPTLSHSIFLIQSKRQT